MQLAEAARNAAADAIAALLNSGDIRFETVGDNEVATNDFGATAFGDAAAGVATANAIADDTDTEEGTIDHALLRDSSQATVIDATVTVNGGGGDFTMPSLAFGDGDTLRVTSLTITVPAA